MGKLSDLWAEYKAGKDVKEEIWKIEDWMISKGYRKERTDFKNKKQFHLNRFSTERDGGHNIPEGAKTGNDRCKACKYNFHVYCDPNDPYGHMAKV